MASVSTQHPVPRSVSPGAVPGETLLHPLVLLSIFALVVNDHWLKDSLGTEPYLNVVTGKASDVAGLVFFPLLVLSLVEGCRWALCRRVSWRGLGPWSEGVSSWSFTHRELVAAVAVTGLGFAAVQSVPAAAQTYAWGLAVLRWLPGVLVAGLVGADLPALPPVSHVMDLSDSLCLPALGLSYLIGRRVQK